MGASELMNVVQPPSRTDGERARVVVVGCHSEAVYIVFHVCVCVSGEGILFRERGADLVVDV